MTKENGLDEEIIAEQASASASTSHSPVEDSQEPPKNADTQQRKKTEENTHVLPYYKLYSFADFTDFLLIGVGTVAAIGNGICMPLMTVLLGNLVNAFGQNANIKQVVDEVSKASLNFVFLAMGAGAVGFLRCQVTLCLFKMPWARKVGKLLQQVATFIAGFVVAFVKGWLLTLVLLSCIPPLFISGAVITIVMGKLAARGQAAYSLAATVSQQTIGAIRTVASFTGEKQAVAKYNDSLSKAYKSGVQEGLASGIGFGSVNFVLYSSYALAVWFGGKMILERGYSGGDVISVIFAVMTGSFSLGQTSQSISAFGPGQAAAYKLFEAIQRKPQIDAYDTNGLKLDDIRGDIELKDVCFSYPARLDEQIFNGFSLSIPSGITAALVGQSGSGKSTVISLIERFYDPQAGEILIDGINLKEFQLKWIREKIGLVSQEPVLFTSSIKDNIAYGKDCATIQEIRAAAELANAAKFIDKLPKGLDTMVGEHGTQLSGGQKQRVAIARAILKDPRILLLDEATSALDAESERTVQEALDRIMINRTTIVVAHRLSTVRNADMIAVIHQGKIVEKGTHSDLAKDPDGAYSQLIRKTFKSTDVFTAIHKRGSSANGNSSRHSISVSFGAPTGIDVLETAPAEAEPLTSSSELSKNSKPPPEVPLSRLAYLNKPEIPVLLLGTIAAESGFMEISWFDEPDHSSGAIGARLSADSASFRRVVGDALSLLVQNIATLIAGLIIAFEANWQMALTVSMLLPLIGANGYIHMKFLKGSTADAKKMYEEASQVANDAVGSIRTVASFCAEEKVMELYQKKCDGPIKAGMKQGVIGGVGFGLTFFLLFLFYAGTFYAGGRLVEAGRATFPEVFRVFYALFLAATGISQSGFLAPDAKSVKGDIEFQHVSFAYPTRPYVLIFTDLCLAIRSGKTVALVGESGSGKSTVISLLQRFYDPDSGRITLDGIEIQKLQLKWLRQQMGLVSQEPVLFNDTIRANIAYGKEGNATEAEILAAAELANAHKFISSLKQGYDTVVGERGIQLSGGQKQRVAIARAIVKDPKILLLDEATSALDAESERVVQDALDRVMVGRTTIVIAHRLSTIKGADLIAVVKNGIIVEKGRHETLVKIKDGVYASLVALHISASS
ncbi:hypothetical protein Patl1_24721 [Pistacia atlantica]|uniref:Uncharacterized protein n=1 Tax=Pistacia atlantica TaxID=434234 RepID=A0ACC1AZG9_9ROSI|nr:hypothetical protein Patl1_24721 [Pistacia atlantica]